MIYRVPLIFLCLAVLAGCYTDAPPEPSQTPEPLLKAMQQQRTVSEVLPAITPRPRLVATATASTGQDMALYEYRPVPQPDSMEVYVSLTFANDTLVSVGSRGRIVPDSWLDEWLADTFTKDPYSPERIRNCVESLEAHEFIDRADYSSSTVRSC